MYDLIDLPELKRMADLAEKAECFDMGCHLNDCGSGGCLLGTWSINTPKDRFKIYRDRDGDLQMLLSGNYANCSYSMTSARFGISNSVVSFLFYDHRRLCLLPASSSATSLPKLEAVARLRKFIAYVERKRALFAEHDWLMSLSRSDRMARQLAPRSMQPMGVS